MLRMLPYSRLSTILFVVLISHCISPLRSETCVKKCEGSVAKCRKESCFRISVELNGHSLLKEDVRGCRRNVDGLLERGIQQRLTVFIEESTNLVITSTQCKKSYRNVAPVWQNDYTGIEDDGNCQWPPEQRHLVFQWRKNGEIHPNLTQCPECEEKKMAKSQLNCRSVCSWVKDLRPADNMTTDNTTSIPAITPKMLHHLYGSVSGACVGLCIMVGFFIFEIVRCKRNRHLKKFPAAYADDTASSAAVSTYKKFIRKRKLTKNQMNGSSLSLATVSHIGNKSKSLTSDTFSSAGMVI